MKNLQWEINQLWFAFKKLRDTKGNFGARDEDITGIIDLLVKTQEEIRKITES